MQHTEILATAVALHVAGLDLYFTVIIVLIKNALFDISWQGLSKTKFF